MTSDVSPIDPGRRRLLAALAAGGAVPLLPWSRAARAGSPPADPCRPPTLATPLRGPVFDLTLAPATVNVTGSAAPATLVNGSLPGPTLIWREGEDVTIRVTNRLAVMTSIHWHGILLPYDQDGVPGISFPGIAPGETFSYRFRVGAQHGTYWYHAHAGYHEQTGVLGAILVEPRDPASAAAQVPPGNDHLLVLSDWTDRDPATLVRWLKQNSDFDNRALPDLRTLLADTRAHGLTDALARRRTWNRMRMNPTDYADLSAFTTYTYLANGRTSTENATLLFDRASPVRLRLVNAAAQTIFDVRIPGETMTVVAIDGVPVEPVTVEEMRMVTAETCDVLVRPGVDACTVFARSIDRSGYVRATLATAPGLEASVPEVGRLEWLEHGDMMGAMGAMGDHGKPVAGDPAQAMPMDGMDMSGHAGHGVAMATPLRPVHHARTEYGPFTDMRVEAPRQNLDDPGPGLRNTGRRVLSLADLKTRADARPQGPDAREPSREIELHCTGSMERYVWGFDGQTLGEAMPIHCRPGERVRVRLVNDTMMTHPIHLHGMWSDIVAPGGEFQVRRHMVPVQPAQQLAFDVTASPGRWAFHCHMLYHMLSGMFREVVVD